MVFFAIDMTEDREFDVVVFGASGFTGKYVVYELLAKASSTLKVAIAGRSKQKVALLLLHINSHLRISSRSVDKCDYK